MPSDSPLLTFEYEIVGHNHVPFWQLWQFWRPRDVVYGTISARSKQDALDALHARTNMTITDVRALSPATALVRRALFHTKVPLSTVIDFIADYSSMTDSGDIAPQSACETLAKMQTNGYLAQVLLSIGAMVGASLKLWEAAQFFPDVFPRYVVAVIRSGEEKAILNEVLIDLEKELRSKNDLKIIARQIVSDMGVTGVSILVMLLVFFLYFVPVMFSVTAPAKANGYAAPSPWWLSIITTPLQITSNVLQSWAFDLAAVAAIAAAVFAFRLYIATPIGRYRWEAFVLRRTGQYGRLIALQCQAEVIRAYARLYELGSVPYDAWTEAAPTADNMVYEEGFLEIRDRTNRGVRLSQALRDSGLVDPRAIARIHAAEPSGPEMLAGRMMTLSADFRAEARRRLEDMGRTWHVRSQYVFGIIIVAVTFCSLAMFGNALINLH